jgi:hypothetical protein
VNRHVGHAELAYAPALHHAQPRVTVVMVVFWTGEALFESIRHVLADPLVDEFVIVDNGSPPDQEEMLRALGRREPRVILIQGHGNVGFARGANRGARAARGETVVFVNPDAFLQRNCVKMLVMALKGRPARPSRGLRAERRRGRTARRPSRRGHRRDHPAELRPPDRRLSQAQGLRDSPRARGPAARRGRHADHLRRLFRRPPQRLHEPRRLRRGLFPARRGHRPVLAGPQDGRRGAVPAARQGRAPRPHQPRASGARRVPQGRRPGPLLHEAGRQAAPLPAGLDPGPADHRHGRGAPALWKITGRRSRRAAILRGSWQGSGRAAWIYLA